MSEPRHPMNPNHSTIWYERVCTQNVGQPQQGSKIEKLRMRRQSMSGTVEEDGEL